MFVIANIRPIGHNVGNTAINFALRNMLYDTFGRLVTIIEFPATSVHESSAKAGLTKKTIHEINRYADGVIVGGGNLYENDEIVVDPVALNNLLPPLMLFSNSRGRIYGRDSQLHDRTDVIADTKLKGLLAASNISLSRDSATVDYTRNLGCDDQLGYCPTINTKSYVERIPALPKNEYVGALISIRTPSLMNIPVRYQSKVGNDLEKFIDTLFESGHKRVRILCNDSRDLDFAQQFKGSRNVDTLYTNDVYEYLAVLRDASIVVSYRLHATLPSISMGTPVVNVTYDERAHCLSNDLGISSAGANLVTDADFCSQICEKISTGGYTKTRHDENSQLWDEISKFQYEKLAEFKELVAQYVQKIRSTNE